MSIPHFRLVNFSHHVLGTITSPQFQDYIRRRRRRDPSPESDGDAVDELLPSFFPPFFSPRSRSGSKRAPSWESQRADSNISAWEFDWNHHSILMTPFALPVSPPFSIHPYLGVNVDDSRVPKIRWDIRQDPATATRYTCRRLTVSLDLDAPATYPELSEVWISLEGIKHRLLPQWDSYICVRSFGAVTIRDILEKVYKHFRPRLMPDEYDYLVNSHPFNAWALEQSWHERCAAFLGLCAYEEQKGIRRVDVLGYDLQFWQALTVQSCGVLKLHLFGPRKNKNFV
jgi:hypothetical protein